MTSYADALAELSISTLESLVWAQDRPEQFPDDADSDLEAVPGFRAEHFLEAESDELVEAEAELEDVHVPSGDVDEDDPECGLTSDDYVEDDPYAFTPQGHVGDAEVPMGEDSDSWD